MTDLIVIYGLCLTCCAFSCYMSWKDSNRRFAIAEEEEEADIEMAEVYAEPLTPRTAVSGKVILTHNDIIY